MRSREWRQAMVLITIGAALLVGAAAAIAAGGKAPSRASVVIGGRESFKPNAYLKVGFHFNPGTIKIRSGGTLTLTNTTEDPHTLSIVKRSQVPRTVGQLENCSACGAILKSHGINFEGPPQQGPPPVTLVNVGAPGFDAPGDSTVIGPKGHGGPVSFKVTARPGTVLNFMCAIHPWMQGRIEVVK